MLPVAIVLWPIAAFGVKACAIPRRLPAEVAKKMTFGCALTNHVDPPSPRPKGGRSDAPQSANGLPKFHRGMPGLR